MRYQPWIKRIGGVLPLTLAVVYTPSVSAQFREIYPESAPTKVESIELTPTRQPFSTPSIAKQEVEEECPVEPMAPAEPMPKSALIVVGPSSPQPTPAVQAAPKPATPSPAKAAQPTVTTPQPTAEVAEAVGDEDEASSEETADADPFVAFQAGDEPSDASVSDSSDAPAVRPTSFNQIEPGTTSVAVLKKNWGEPAKSSSAGGETILVYRVPGFQQIDVIADQQGTVTSIVIHLESPLSADTLVEHLRMQEIEEVVVTDGKNETLGWGFPERGVLMSSAQAASRDAITHLVLEPVRGDLFRLRAKYDTDNSMRQSLADLNRAIELDPNDAEAFWLRAELQSRTGFAEDAFRSATQACQLRPTHALYRLTRARLRAERGELEEGIRETRSILDDESISDILRARAEYQLGNLLAIGQEPEHQESLNHHMKSIDLAAPYLIASSVDERRMAKDILVDAHLAIAQDIALGSFQRQREVVPKWLARATELAEDYIAHDQGDPAIRMEIYRTTLATYSVLEGNFDTSIAIEECLEEGRRLIASNDDPYYQHLVERELSESLFHASRLEHRRGSGDEAMTFAENAVALLESQDASRQPTVFDRVMSGQLYFFVGSLYAVHGADHQEAVRWYEKAQPFFDHDGTSEVINKNAFGELFVSMGVSYWETGAKERAVELTQVGAELMQNSVQAGELELVALTVPYGNLAAMHRDLGNGDEAKHFASMMAKIESPANDTTTR